MNANMTPKQLKEYLLSVLEIEKVTIVFTKTNGELREMVCTLNPLLINDTYIKKTDRKKLVNEEVMSVWDCDKQAWRSFRLDSVNEIRMEFP